MSEDVIEIKITPTSKLFYNDESNYGVYKCEVKDRTKIKLNKDGEITIVGNTVALKTGREYNANLTEIIHKQYGTQYEIQGLYEDIPTDINNQKSYLLTLLTENQVNEIYKAYPNTDIIDLIKNDAIDVQKIKGVGNKTLTKIKDRIIENTEFQEAFLFLSSFNVTNNLIIKLVKHFKSAKLLIEKMKQNGYVITEVSGVGFKKADAIAMNMGHDPEGKDRMLNAIEHVLEEDSKKGHTYCYVSDIVDMVYNLTEVDMSIIKKYIIDTQRVILLNDCVALRKNYEAEKHVSQKLIELIYKKPNLQFDAEEYITKQEKIKNITLTEQQKSLYMNIQKSSVSLLVGYAGTGKSFSVEMLIELLEKLNVGYRLLSPTGKAAKVLQGYTNRNVETIHRAAGLGMDGWKGQKKVIEEEYIIIDETSMVDIITCSRLLHKCINKNLKLLFIGDAFQLVSVSAGNLLHDMIESKIIPTTMLNVVFRQKEGGILDIATKIRKKQNFLKNNDWGIFEFGNNCTIACAPQEKIEKGYQYYYNNLIKTFKSDEITIASPTKKSDLGTVEINKHIQDIINPSDRNKNEKKFGYDEIMFREGDDIINIKNTYDISDINKKAVDIVNGDMGKIIKIDIDDKKIIVDFGFTKVPFPFKMLNQLLHCWSMTIHKLQGSSNRVIIIILDKSHKYQINANMLYTAVSRSVDQLIILSQAETINYAIKKVANLQRNTFLKEMLQHYYKDKLN